MAPEMVLAEQTYRALKDAIMHELTPTEPSVTPSDAGRIEIRRGGDFTVSIDRLVDREALRLALEVVGELER